MVYQLTNKITCAPGGNLYPPQSGLPPSPFAKLLVTNAIVEKKYQISHTITKLLLEYTYENKRYMSSDQNNCSCYKKKLIFFIQREDMHLTCSLDMIETYQATHTNLPADSCICLYLYLFNHDTGFLLT